MEVGEAFFCFDVVVYSGITACGNYGAGAEIEEHSFLFQRGGIQRHNGPRELWGWSGNRGTHMLISNVDDKSTVYARLLEMLFSGSFAPGTKLSERELARKLGVSRIPVRESIRQMIGQGLLVGGRKGDGVWTRTYTAADIRQLGELRESLEAGSARAAAVNATETDLTRMEMICDESDAVIGKCDRERWAQLEHHFHTAVVEASHNERLIHNLNHLLVECHYVFFLRLMQLQPWRSTNEEWLAGQPHTAGEHRALVEAIRAGDEDLADKIIRDHISVTCRQATREMIALSLEK
jgi:DNA-binding GntR family transcriptional regulator